MSCTDPTLVVLAAGMGSRYGGLKQIDHFGPSGETLLDYALYDALAAGFAKVVFVIRRSFESDFRAVVESKYEDRVSVAYVFQELDELPAGFAAFPGRTKPWGTAHAIWCVRGSVSEPFACVNADDYYGKHAYHTAARHLVRAASAGPTPECCVVGYPALQTLSEHGAVTRAICEVDAGGLLTALTERRGMQKWKTTGRYMDETGGMRVLQGSEVVSMNMFGFAPAIFDQLERHLADFLEAQRQAPDDSECVLPVVIGKLVAEGAARVRVLPTTGSWFGVTHAQDKPGVIEILREMVERGDYPSPIWGEG